METARFVVDHMLGRLAKWLRLLGYDACYQQQYSTYELHSMIQEGRRFLTRGQKRKKDFPQAIFLSSERVEQQLRQLQQGGLLYPPSYPFSRCIRCNSLLIKSNPSEVIGQVPEYVTQTNPCNIKQCPSCGRHYWPGTHRSNMESQLKAWGITYPLSLREPTC